MLHVTSKIGYLMNTSIDDNRNEFQSLSNRSVNRTDLESLGVKEFESSTSLPLWADTHAARWDSRSVQTNMSRTYGGDAYPSTDVATRHHIASLNNSEYV